MSLGVDIRNRFLAGVAVVVPLVVSVWVIITVASTIAGFLSPLRAVFRNLGFTGATVVTALQVASLAGVLFTIFVIGTATQRRLGKRAVSTVDEAIQRIPGVGTVYQTVRRMSDLLIQDDGGAGQFHEVKLVEFPGEETYTLGFLTSVDPPRGVVESAQRIQGVESGEYRTLFLPMAPNPVMGGHLTHIPADRVYDVDLSVEEAIQYILTMGLVTTDDEASAQTAIEAETAEED